jgi:hypothetical protein
MGEFSRQKRAGGSDATSIAYAPRSNPFRQLFVLNPHENFRLLDGGIRTITRRRIKKQPASASHPTGSPA